MERFQKINENKDIKWLEFRPLKIKKKIIKIHLLSWLIKDKNSKEINICLLLRKISHKIVEILKNNFVKIKKVLTNTISFIITKGQDKLPIISITFSPLISFKRHAFHAFVIAIAFHMINVAHQIVRFKKVKIQTVVWILLIKSQLSKRNLNVLMKPPLHKNQKALF